MASRSSVAVSLRVVFGPSRRRWNAADANTASADFPSALLCLHAAARPFEQALLTGTPIGSPQIRTCCVPAQVLHLPTPRYFQFGFALSCTLTRSRRPNEVPVRNLAGLGEKMADDDSLSAYRASSQASSPRFVTLPQLPSPRTKFDVGYYIRYTAPGFKLLELSTGD